MGFSHSAGSWALGFLTTNPDQGLLPSWFPEGSEGSEGVTKVLVVLACAAFRSGGRPLISMPGEASVRRYIFMALSPGKCPIP